MWCRMMTGQDVVVGIGGGVGVLDGIDVVLCGKPMKSFLLFVLVAAFGLLCQINCQTLFIQSSFIHTKHTLCCWCCANTQSSLGERLWCLCVVLVMFTETTSFCHMKRNEIVQKVHLFVLLYR